MLMKALGVVFQAVECNFSHLQMAIIGKHPEKNSLMAVRMWQRIVGKLMGHAKQSFLHSFIRFGVRCRTEHRTLCALFFLHLLFLCPQPSTTAKLLSLQRSRLTLLLHLSLACSQTGSTSPWSYSTTGIPLL